MRDVKESADGRVRSTVLENGLTIVSENMPYLETAALGLWVQSGSRAEREREHGIAHLLEHMAFKGTKTRSAQEIAEEIEAVGGELNAVTGLESTAYLARVLKADVGLACDLLTDIVLHSRFDAAELDREKGVIVQEILAANDTPDDLVFDLMQEAAFPKQSVGRSILGTSQSVRSFSADSLNLFLKRNYAPGRMIVSAAGAVDHDMLVSDFGERFDNHDVADVDLPAQAEFATGSKLLERPLEQVHMVMGFNGLAIGDPRIIAAQVLTTILGGGMSSRLFQEVRERRGLCYGIYAYHWALSDSGLFGIYAGTGPDDVGELAEVVFGELERLHETLVESEVARAKAQLKAGLMMSLESPSARIEQMARHMGSFGRIIEPSELVSRVEAVTVEDIGTLSRDIYTSESASIAAIGPSAGLEKLASVVPRLKSVQ